MEKPRTEDNRRDEIARRAHERYQERGGEHGDDQADWFEAEREISERNRGSEDEPGSSGAA